MKYLLMISLIAGCGGCNQKVVVPITVPDGGTVEAGAPCALTQSGPDDNCYKAGVRLCELKCVGSKGESLWVSQKGHPYSDVCRLAISDNRDMTINRISRSACLVSITTCADVNGVCR